MRRLFVLTSALALTSSVAWAQYRYVVDTFNFSFRCELEVEDTVRLQSAFRTEMRVYTTDAPGELRVGILHPPSFDLMAGPQDTVITLAPGGD